MPKCMIDGREVEFTPGQNLIEVAKSAGIEIPVFCYHPGLSVVAQCRMCAVEIEKFPKLQTACSTPAQDGMVVKTQSDKVTRNSVMRPLAVWRMIFQLSIRPKPSVISCSPVLMFVRMRVPLKRSRAPLSCS